MVKGEIKKPDKEGNSLFAGFLFFEARFHQEAFTPWSLIISSSKVLPFSDFLIRISGSRKTSVILLFITRIGDLGNAGGNGQRFYEQGGTLGRREIILGGLEN